MRFVFPIALALILAAGGVVADSPRNLVLAIGGEPENGFDPLVGWGAYGNPLFQSTLLRRDAHLQQQMDLAASLDLSDDRKVWTIKIRPGMRFSDGSALTAGDVAFTFSTAKTAASAVDLSVMERAEALDDETVRITLAKPWITFVETFFTLGIVPEASYGPHYGRDPVGSGPYRLVSWVEGEQLIVSPNPHYSGQRAAFDQITFLFTGADAGLAAAVAGQVDLVAVPAQMADAVPRGFHALPVRTVDNRGISLPFGPPRQEGGRKIGNSVTSDPEMRRAINLGLDRDLIIDVALHGHGQAAFGPADGLPWGQGQAAYPSDPEKARAILDAAGWVADDDGIRSRDGVRATFPINYPASDPTRQALAEVAAELLRPLGIDAVPRGGSWDSIGRVMHSEPVVFGFGSHSPYQLYSLYASRLGGVEYMNPSYYANPAADALFEKAQAAESLEFSYPFWNEAAKHFGSEGDNAWAWLVNLDHVYLVSDCLDLGDLQIEPHGHGWPITASLAEWRWTCE